MLLPPALGFSPHPPVSVSGTGPHRTIAAFLGSKLTVFPTLCSVRIMSSDCRRAFPLLLLPHLHRAFLSRLPLARRVPAVLSARGAGISTCCPSATPPGLALGPDLPRADQLYPGNLGYSAARIPTSLSLLIPAFSLPHAPQLLPVLLRCVWNAPLPTFRFCGFGVVFQPRTFSAQDLSTSELLRTL